MKSKILKKFVTERLNPGIKDLENFVTINRLRNEKYFHAFQFSTDNFSLKARNFTNLVFKTDGEVLSFSSKKVKVNFIGKFRKKREAFILKPSFLILASGDNNFITPGVSRFFDIYLSENLYNEISTWFKELCANFKEV